MSTERARSSAVPWLLGALVGAPLVTDCTSDHGALAARPHPAAAGRAGGAGMAGTAGRSPIGGSAAKGGTGGTINPDKHEEVPGRSVFTLVHGVVDAERLVFCFARVRDGKTELVGDPVPMGGLAYGASLSFETLPHIDSEGDGVVPYIITGDLSLVDGLDCAEAVVRAGGPELSPTAGVLALGGAGGQSGEGGQSGQSDGQNGGQSGETSVAGQGPSGGTGGTTTGVGGEPATGSGGAPSAGTAGIGGTPQAPPLRVGALPGLPAGALAEGYSLLAVADGCFGAPGFERDDDDDICGFGYTPSEGSLTAELVILGRATSDKLALQALHASRGSGGLGVRSAPPPDAVDSWVTLVDNFTEGALRPIDPRRDLDSAAWGTRKGTWTVDATVSGGPVLSERWPVVKQRAGIDDLEDGRGYTLIVMGPSYTVEGKGWWNPPAFGLVDNDPGGD